MKTSAEQNDDVYVLSLNIFVHICFLRVSNSRPGERQHPMLSILQDEEYGGNYQKVSRWLNDLLLEFIQQSPYRQWLMASPSFFMIFIIFGVFIR